VAADPEKINQPGANLGHYVLLGEPIAWARASYHRGHVYDVQKALKAVLREQLQDQHKRRPLFKGPLDIVIVFVMKMPHTTRNKKAVDGYHYFRPDLDNLEKLLVELGTGVLYKDDCQIAQCFKKKIYGETPRIEFTIKELE
jgi:Holliday junction resolvase RusA-like endonuclease